MHAEGVGAGACFPAAMPDGVTATGRGLGQSESRAPFVLPADACAPLEVGYLRMLMELSCGLSRQQQRQRDEGKLILPS